MITKNHGRAEAPLGASARHTLEWAPHTSVRLMLVVVIASLAACAAPTTLDRPQPDRERVILPLDEYIVPLRSHMKEAYVRDVLIADCLARDGISLPAVRPQHVPATEEGPSRAVQFGIQTPDQAAAAGYRITLDPDTRAEYDLWADREASVRALNQRELSMLDDCYDAATAETVDLLGGSLVDLQFGSVVGAGARDPLLDNTVIPTLAPWCECVMKAGLDIPAGTTPLDMPTEAVRRSVESAPDPWGEERRIAAIDTACREEVGYGRAYYDALFEAQVEAIESNYAELVDVRDQIRTIEARLEEVITELEAGR